MPLNISPIAFALLKAPKNSGFSVYIKLYNMFKVFLSASPFIKSLSSSGVITDDMFAVKSEIDESFDICCNCSVVAPEKLPNNSSKVAVTSSSVPSSPQKACPTMSCIIVLVSEAKDATVDSDVALHKAEHRADNILLIRSIINFTINSSILSSAKSNENFNKS